MSIALTGKFRAKQLAVQPLAFAVDLIRGGAQAAQHGLGHRQRHFAFAREHVLGAGAAQLRDIAQVRAAREDVDGGFSSRATRIVSGAPLSAPLTISVPAWRMPAATSVFGSRASP